MTELYAAFNDEVESILLRNRERKLTAIEAGDIAASEIQIVLRFNIGTGELVLSAYGLEIFKQPFTNKILVFDGDHKVTWLDKNSLNDIYTPKNVEISYHLNSDLVTVRKLAAWEILKHVYLPRLFFLLLAIGALALVAGAIYGVWKFRSYIISIPMDFLGMVGGLIIRTFL